MSTAKTNENPSPPLAGAAGSEDFQGLRFAVRLAKGGGNTEWASWKDIEELLAAYDELKPKRVGELEAALRDVLNLTVSDGAKKIVEVTTAAEKTLTPNH